MFGRRGGEGAADLQRCHALAERMEGGGGVVDATRAEADLVKFLSELQAAGLVERVEA